MKHETVKLKEVGFSKEVDYMTWLSNVVLVKKSNSKWRMCVDYTDLIKAFNGASSFEILSFLDAYSNYS
ncbi:hypothetical protein CR513_13252, partial [Mucuna pruriens]